MSCLQTIQDYGLRSIGIGERLLPRSDFTLCQQFTLIASLGHRTRHNRHAMLVVGADSLTTGVRR